MNDEPEALIPLADAAAQLGIEPKRLMGFCVRNGIGDPIAGRVGDQVMVYPSSLETLRKRLEAERAGQ